MGQSELSSGDEKLVVDQEEWLFSAAIDELPCCASNPRVGGSNPSGRAAKPQVRGYVSSLALPMLIKLGHALDTRRTVHSTVHCCESPVPLSHIGSATCFANRPGSGSWATWAPIPMPH
jgi:hypothetical protein